MDWLKGQDSWSVLSERIPRIRPREAALLLAGGLWEASGVLRPPPAMEGPYAAAAMLWLMVQAGLEAPAGLEPSGGEILDLRGEAVPALPGGLGSFSAVRALHLCGNGLDRLDESLGEMAGLAVLSLGRNRISGLPRSTRSLWQTLSKLYLGDNRISSLPFHEDDMLIWQGSIGTNPLPEPVGERWMLRADAQAAADRILELFDAAASTPSSVDARFLVERGVFLARHLDEPMIYGRLFEGVSVADGGLVQWSGPFNGPARKQPWLRFAALRLLPSITPGSIVHPSLWRRNLLRLDLSCEKLPEEPVELAGLEGCSLVLLR